MKKLLILFFTTFIIFEIFSCNKKVEHSNISLKNDLIPLFVRSCGICHKRGGNEAAIKNKVYYEKTSDIIAKINHHIIPGDPDQSGLLKVLSQNFKVGENKTIMPPPNVEVPSWSKSELSKMAAWIKAGAKEN